MQELTRLLPRDQQTPENEQFIRERIQLIRQFQPLFVESPSFETAKELGQKLAHLFLDLHRSRVSDEESLQRFASQANLPNQAIMGVHQFFADVCSQESAGGLEHWQSLLNEVKSAYRIEAARMLREAQAGIPIPGSITSIRQEATRAEQVLRERLLVLPGLTRESAFSEFGDYCKRRLDHEAQLLLEGCSRCGEFRRRLLRSAIRIIQEILPGHQYNLTVEAYRKRMANIPMPVETTQGEDGRTMLLIRQDGERRDEWYLEAFPEWDQMQAPHSLWEEVLVDLEPFLAFEVRTVPGRRRIRIAMKAAMRPRIIYWAARAETLSPKLHVRESIGSIRAQSTETPSPAEKNTPMRTNPKVSDKEIYSRAQVSKETFYKAKRGEKVKSTTLDKIREAKAALGLTPNA